MKSLSFTLFFLVCWITQPALAQGEVILSKNPLKILSTHLEHAQLPEGSNTALSIEVELEPQHHAYQEQFRVTTQSDWIKATQPTVTPLTEFHDPVSKKTKQGMKAGTATIQTVVGIAEGAPAGVQKAQFQLVYQACTAKYCLLPKRIPFEVEVQVDKPNSNWSSPIKSVSNISTSTKIEELLSESIWLAFLIVFIAGVLTSFTPCIFPMIPITMAVLGARSEERSKIAGLGLSLSYVLGIAITYSVLGLIAASTGALFGSFLGHPAVAIGLSLLFFAMALSMFGLFEIQPPAFIRDRIGLHKTKGGVVGAFFTGQIAGILASPCVGPVLVALLAFVAKTQNLSLGFLLLFTFAFGMGQIFLVIGTFSQTLKKLPKAGHWMVTVKLLMGTAMLGLSLFYLQPILPKTWLQNVFSFKSEKVESIQWQTYSPEVFTQAKAEGKPVIIDFYADWCAACIEMELKTFSSSQIQAIKHQFVWIKYDATDTSTEEFQTLKQKYDIPGLPWFVFYDNKGQHLKELTLAGFENVEDFLQRLKKTKVEN